MVSILVTAYKEERTIAAVVKHLVDGRISGLGKGRIDKDWEFILVAPDEATKDRAKKALSELGLKPGQYKILTDACQGKPVALNQALQEAKGDYLLLTDGDVVFAENAVAELIKVMESDESIGGVTGRPISAKNNSDCNMTEYWGKLLADAAHHKRLVDLTDQSEGYSQKLIPKRRFFPLSGYIMLIKNLGLSLPKDVLVDDAYISYEISNKGYRLAYAPDAKVSVKYPDNTDDYYKQKKRSAGGYVQLWKYGVVDSTKKSRSFWRELEYFWFPIKYASSAKELIWSLLLYPNRLWLWLLIFWERKVIKKDFTKTWVRIESTK